MAGTTKSRRASKTSDASIPQRQSLDLRPFATALLQGFPQLIRECTRVGLVHGSNSQTLAAFYLASADECEEALCMRYVLQVGEALGEGANNGELYTVELLVNRRTKQ